MDGFETQSTGTDATTESVAQRVIETVAETVGADPLDIDPLYETIDPDALDQIFRTGGGSESGHQNRIVFTYAGCEVTVYGTDEIEVTQLTADEADVVIGKAKPTIRSN